MNEIKTKHEHGKITIKKTTIILILVLLSFLLSLIIAYLIYAYIYRKHHEPPATAQSTTQESIYDFDTQKMLLTLTPKVKKAAFSGRKNEIDNGTYLIPGLYATQTQLYGKKQSSDICTSMTPQGLTVTENYLLVSAYCQTQKHNSVIYVIDKETHAFVKEIVLRNRSHVGGLAYDPIYENIWFCGTSNGIPQVNAITLQDIEEYHFQDEYLPISYSQAYDLYAIARTSFLAYHDDCLYVGYFTTNSSSVLEEYQIIDGGLLKTQLPENELASLDTTPFALPSDTIVIEDQAQGLSFYQDYMLFSHSYGMKSSTLQVFKDSYMKLLESEQADFNIRFPSRMEQICVDGDDLYVLFESAAYAYRASSLVQLDRILKLDLNILLED